MSRRFCLWKRRPLSGGEALFPCRGSPLHLLPVAAPAPVKARPRRREVGARDRRDSPGIPSHLWGTASPWPTPASGVDVLVKRVARIMTECGLVGVHPRPRWRRGKANTAPAPDRHDSGRLCAPWRARDLGTTIRARWLRWLGGSAGRSDRARPTRTPRPGVEALGFPAATARPRPARATELEARAPCQTAKSGWTDRP